MSRQRSLRASVRVAELGDLNAYFVYEHQLDQLAQGSPAGLMLNMALFFLGIAATAFGTLWSVPISDDRAYYTFLILFLLTLFPGIVLLILSRSSQVSIRRLVEVIKAQLPPNPGTQAQELPPQTAP